MRNNTTPRRYQTITVDGRDTRDAEHIARAVLETDAGLVVHATGRGRLALARTQRPTWALVACICTFWIAGLGLLFLLVRDTESGDLTVVGTPRGVVVTVPPLVAADLVGRLEAELRADGRPTGAVSTGTIPEAPPVDDLDGHTVVRGLPATPTGHTTTGSLVELRFPGGVISMAPGEDLVIGRDPSQRDGCRSVTVPGDGATLSKSHLLVRFRDARLEIEDLGSTNGTRLASGRALEPGETVVVAPGTSFDLGAVRCTVELQPTSTVAPK